MAVTIYDLEYIVNPTSITAQRLSTFMRYVYSVIGLNNMRYGSVAGKEIGISMYGSVAGKLK